MLVNEMKKKKEMLKRLAGLVMGLGTFRVVIDEKIEII